MEEEEEQDSWMRKNNNQHTYCSFYKHNLLRNGYLVKRRGVF